MRSTNGSTRPCSTTPRRACRSARSNWPTGSRPPTRLRYTPRRLLRATATYRVPQLDALKLGATLRWQDDVSTTVGSVRVTQAAYALIDLMARYEINRHLSITAKLNNATDEKYLTSLYWAQSYYGAPRNLSITANWTY